MMLSEDQIIDRIKSLPDGMTKSKAGALLKASVATWRKINEGQSSAALLRDAQAADEALAALLDRAEAAGNGEADGPDPDERFRTRKEALEWLQSQGAAVSQGKFYADCKAGKVLVFKNKSVSRASVMQYLINLQQDQAVFNPDAADLDMRKRVLEIELLEYKVAREKHATRKEDREWMLREDSWALLAGVLGMLRQSLDYHINRQAPELAASVEGRADLAPQMVDGLLLGVVNPAFNDLAGKTLENACFAYMPAPGEETDEQE